MKGIEKNTLQNNVNLNGAKKGEATSVAIILLPSGNLAIRGVAIKSYIWLEKGIRNNVITKIHAILRKAVVLNSCR